MMALQSMRHTVESLNKLHAITGALVRVPFDEYLEVLVGFYKIDRVNVLALARCGHYSPTSDGRFVWTGRGL